MTKKKMIEKIPLSNGETLEIHDLSRNIAADTWLVSMIFKITIDVKKINFNAWHPITDKQMTDKIGDQLVYEVKHERNFIREPLRDAVYKEVRDSFLNTNLKYLSHPDFVVKYALKKYNEKKPY